MVYRWFYLTLYLALQIFFLFGTGNLEKIYPYSRTEKINESREMRRREIVNEPSSIRKNQFKLIFFFFSFFFFINAWMILQNKFPFSAGFRDGCSLRYF